MREVHGGRSLAIAIPNSALPAELVVCSFKDKVANKVRARKDTQGQFGMGGST